MSARSASSAPRPPTRSPPRPTSSSRSARACRTSPPDRGPPSPRTRHFISINTARFDAAKHRALAVIGDARETVAELEAGSRRLDRPTRPDGQGTRAPSPSGTAARRPAEAHERSGSDLCPGRRRGQRQGGRPRPRHHGRRRASRRGDEELARQGRRTPSTASSASPAWATRSRRDGAPPWPTRPARRSSWSATAPT